MDLFRAFIWAILFYGIATAITFIRLHGQNSISILSSASSVQSQHLHNSLRQFVLGNMDNHATPEPLLRRKDVGHKETSGSAVIDSKDHDAVGSIAKLSPTPKGRFPDDGTREFTRKCSWTQPLSLPTTSAATDLPPCTIFVRPAANENEGIALWVSQIVVGHLIAVQAQCRLMFDYGEGVQIREVLQPTDSNLHNWAVPDGFVCKREDNCFRLIRSGKEEVAAYNFTEQIPRRDMTKIAPVPFYRFALWKGTHTPFYESTFRELERSMSSLSLAGAGTDPVSFNLRTGFACSLGRLFHLAPTASKYEPRLFTQILPALRDEKSAVLCLYIRSSQSDFGNGTINEEHHRKSGSPYIRRAQMLEQVHLMNLGIKNNAERDIHRVIWLVITDSTYLKGYIKSLHDRKDANAMIPRERQRFPGRKVERRILCTESRGLHSKAKERGGTDVWAEAFIDWYLIGESDMVIAGPVFTFGLTASLRTARPVHDYGDGKQLRLVQPGDPPPEGSAAGKPAGKGQVVMVDGKPFDISGCVQDPGGMWLCTGKTRNNSTTTTAEQR